MPTKLDELFVEITAQADDFFSDIGKAEERLTRAGAAMTRIGAGLTVGLTVPLIGAGAAALTAAGDFEQTEIAFNTLLGSAEAAGDFLKELESFAAKTPFEFPELVDASKRLLAMGFAAEDIIPTMTAVGDTVAALGGGGALIDRVTTALGQMGAKGKVSAEEMLQLTEAGIPAWELLAEKIGVSVPQAMKLASKGAIDSQTAIAALVEGMGDRFSGLMEKQSTTLLGQISTLKDEFGFVIRDLGGALLPIAKDILEAFKPIIPVIQNLVKWFADLPTPAKQIAVAIAGVAAAAGPVLLILGQLAGAAGTLVGLFGSGGILAGAFGGFGAILTAVTGPIGLTVAAIAAVGVAIFAFRDDIAASRLGEMWGGLWQTIQETASTVTTALSELLSAFLEFFATVWNENLGGVQTQVQFVWDTIGNIFVGALETISAVVTTGLTLVADTIKVGTALFTGDFESAWEGIKTLFANALRGIIELTSAQLGTVLNVIDDFAKAVSGKDLGLAAAFDKQVQGVTKALKIQDKALADSQKPLSDLGKAAEGTAKQADKLDGPTKRASFAIKGLGDESKKTKEKLDDLPKPMRFVLESAEDLEKQTIKIRDEWRKLRNQELRDLISDFPVFSRSIEDTTQAATDAIRQMNALSGALDTQQIKMGEVNIAAITLESATKTLGIRTAEVARTDIAKLTEAIEVYRKQAAEGVPGALENLAAAEKAYADKLKGAGGAIETTSIWSGALTQVSTAITDLGKDIAERFTEKIKTGIGFVDDLAAAFIRLASEQVLGAVVKKLAEVIDFIPGLRNLSGTLFGTAGSAAGSAAGAAGQVAGTAGGVAGTAGGAAGTAASTGAAAITGIVTGIVSAVTGVIGVFQNARQETTLNAIEESTRRGTLFLGDRADGGILGVLFRVHEALSFGPMVKAAESAKDRLDFIGNVRLGDVKDAIFQKGDQIVAAISALGDRIVTPGTAQQFGQVQFAGAGGGSLASIDRLASAIERQQPSVTIQNMTVNGTDRRAAESTTAEMERILRSRSRGIR